MNDRPPLDKRETKTVFVFAGTTEGRQVIERLLRHGGVRVTAFTATDYGGALLSGMNCEIRAGRLDEAAMERALAEARPDVVVDAAHPYAVIVHRHIKAAAEKTDTPYIRLARELGDCPDMDAVRVKSASEAAAFLADKAGNIFLAIGAKEAAAFSGETMRERVFVRILALEESVNHCRALGFPAKNIIAMQGPFSEELNTVLFRESRAAWLVTKMSGKEGGFEEKLEAARVCNMTVVLIEPPEDAVEGSGNDAETKTIDAVFRMLGLDDVEKTEAAPSPTQISVVLIGAGPGSAAFWTEEARSALEKSDCVIGAQVVLDRHARFIEKKAQKALFKPKEIAAFIEQSAENGDFCRFAVLVSGDGGFYSLSRTLVPVLRERGLSFTLVPGISSLALLAARLGIPWEDVKTVSLHGRGGNPSNLITGMVSKHGKTFFLTDEKTTPAVICRVLTDNGLGGVMVSVGEDLSLPTERVRRGTAASLVDAVFSPLNAALVERAAEQSAEQFAPCCPFSTDDGAFLRGNVPMTKREVRAAVLARLKIQGGDTVWDIGAGTGALTCTAALCAVYGRVYAVEQNAEACELVRQNGEKFGLHNIEIVAGRAPDALLGLPPPDAVFIGGGGGEIPAIVEAVFAKNRRCRVVITAITLETIAAAAEISRRPSIKNAEITQIAVSRTHEAGVYHLIKAENPVFVFSFDFLPEGAPDGASGGVPGGGA